MLPAEGSRSARGRLGETVAAQAESKGPEPDIFAQGHHDWDLVWATARTLLRSSASPTCYRKFEAPTWCENPSGLTPYLSPAFWVHPLPHLSKFLLSPRAL